jgi:hypothetical protein
MMDFSIDLGNVASNSCLPAGDYAVQCVGVELKNTKDLSGKYVVTQFEVLSGDRKGARIFTNFNIQNRNQTAVEIALRSIKQWVQACGLRGDEQLTMGLLQSLQGKEVFANVGIEQDKSGQYEPKNVIKRFHVGSTPAADGNPTPATSAKYRAPAAAAQAAKNPWEK